MAFWGTTTGTGTGAGSWRTTAGAVTLAGIGLVSYCSSESSSLSLKKFFFVAAAFLATVVFGLSAKLLWSRLPSAVTPPADAPVVTDYRFTWGGAELPGAALPPIAAGLMRAASSAIDFGLAGLESA